ncbi:MAG: hypothetical protein KGR26_04880, partial [Cyanobacteria bacterium REEB65]|nr:hypothetical protein [Cyanobacteria bacterium REEB65]
GTIGSASGSAGIGSFGGFNFAQQGQTSYENYTYSEPTAIRAGGGWDGPLGFSAAAEVSESFDNPSNHLWADTPAFNLGVQESLFNVLYLRAGTQIGGLNSLLGGGLGLNLGLARLDLGAATGLDLGEANVATPTTIVPGNAGVNSLLSHLNGLDIALSLSVGI